MSETAPSLELPIVGIGASAGGLEALREVFQGHKGLTGMAFVVVQHLDPNHESLMAQLLEKYTEMTVLQATGGETVAADHIYVIPPGNGLALRDGTLELTDFRNPRGMRRPIDDFFETLADEAGNRAACVILSGTGGDGSRGLRAIKEHGGLAVVQDPASARYDGMPVSAISTGLVDIVLPPAQVIEGLRNFFDRASDLKIEEATDAADHIDDMCATLRDAVGHDFTGYKRSTLARRIARRMQVLDIETSGEYLERMKVDSSECHALFRDLLINVTRFFRDTEEFSALQEQVIDPMIANARDARELRIWVAGCSSGEEAYSIAMLVADAMKRHNRHPYVQVFATDIDDKMLEIARGATYPSAALSDIPAQYHAEYLQIGMEQFTIAPRIRDMVRFSSHNVVRDPPYSKIDLVCCRNLLIYFDEELQREVIPGFHFALAEGGYLFLGSSESISRFDDLFETLDQRNRIFRRRETVSRYPLRFRPRPQRKAGSLDDGSSRSRRQPPLSVAALTSVAERHAPPSILADAEGNVLNHWGQVGRYLDFPDRAMLQLNVIRQARSGLGELLGPMIREVLQNKAPKVARSVKVDMGFGTQEVAILVEPVETTTVLILFRETAPFEATVPDMFEEYERGTSEIQFLQEELQSVRLRLRTTVEELETANEELKSSNEEMMSMNEELQSTNEELTTVNDELKAKVDQVSSANADLKNFFDSTELVVLVVDGELNLRSYTEVENSPFQLTQALIGMSLAMVPSTLPDRDYLQLAKDAAHSGNSSSYTVTDPATDNRYVVKVLPYRMLDGSLAGATLVFTDVTQVTSLQTALAEEQERSRMALEVAEIGVWEYEPSSGRTTLDAQERKLLDIKEDADGEFIDPILARLPSEDRDRVNAALLQAMDGRNVFDETFRVRTEDDSIRWLHGLGRRVKLGDTEKFIGVTYDVTAERQMLASRDLMLREMNHRVKNLFAVITAISKLTAREATSVKDFAAELDQRVQALGRSHAMTIDGTFGEVELRALVDASLAAVRGDQRITIEGGHVQLPNRAITPVAMILHEWVTNATKYGALSTGDGVLTIDWAEDDGSLVLNWAEQGGEGGSQQDGFGTRLVAASAQQLGAKSSAEIVEGGFRRSLRLPLELITS